ncbi:MAG: queuosine precursor transporter [Bacilli bacterium]|nr:queuosine precursor transporter [Bacilli bacterium]
MNSTILLVLELVLCLITQTFLYKHYKTAGLYSYIIICLILTSLMSLKTITLYNFDVNLGIIPFITVFTSSNIIIQKNGPDAIKQLILTISVTSIISYAILYLVQLQEPSNINLFTSASYDNIFVDSLRMYFANFVTTLYSLLLNAKLYYYLKKMKNNILISNLFSTIIIHFLASILFGLIAYVFIKDPIDIIKIIMIRYLVSLIVGLIGTIPIYITKKVTE